VYRDWGMLVRRLLHTQAHGGDGSGTALWTALLMRIMCPTSSDFALNEMPLYTWLLPHRHLGLYLAGATYPIFNPDTQY
jgi:hypothetical protein